MAQSQNKRIKEEILRLIEDGTTDKKIIFDIIESDSGLPRPTIRRCARNTRIWAEEICEILGSDIGKNGTS